MLHFHHLLEQHDLGGLMLDGRGVRIAADTIVIIDAPFSIRGERDPEMHQTRKGQQW